MVPYGSYDHSVHRLSHNSNDFLGNPSHFVFADCDTGRDQFPRRSQQTFSQLYCIGVELRAKSEPLVLRALVSVVPVNALEILLDYTRTQTRVAESGKSFLCTNRTDCEG